MHNWRILGYMEGKRITVTLEGAEQAALSTFADPQRMEHAVLEAWANERGLPLKSSEAAIVRVLLRAGVEALMDKALERGYAHLAEAQHADEDRRAERQSRRARRSEHDRTMPA
jgi:predicted kinase